MGPAYDSERQTFKMARHARRRIARRIDRRAYSVMPVPGQVLPILDRLVSLAEDVPIETLEIDVETLGWLQSKDIVLVQATFQ